jgi:hypothetical protein
MMHATKVQGGAFAARRTGGDILANHCPLRLHKKKTHAAPHPLMNASLPDPPHHTNPPKSNTRTALRGPPHTNMMSRRQSAPRAFMRALLLVAVFVAAAPTAMATVFTVTSTAGALWLIAACHKTIKL